MRNTIHVPLAVTLALVVASCGGSSSTHVSFRSKHTVDDDNGNHHDEGGLVVIVVHDAPADELAEFHMTFAEIALEDGRGAVADIVDSDLGHDIELLSLRARGDEQPLELLAFRREVPEGRYDRVRLRLREPRLVLRGGDEVPSAMVDFSGTGEVVAVAARPFTVSSDDPVVITLDFDVDRSLRRSPSFGPARRASWRLRPVVDVASASTSIEGLRVRVAGVPGERAAAANDFGFALHADRGLVRVRGGGSLPSDTGGMILGRFDERAEIVADSVGSLSSSEPAETETN